jgi:hypothetical protein
VRHAHTVIRAEALGKIMRNLLRRPLSGELAGDLGAQLRVDR